VNETRHDQRERELQEAHLAQAIGLLACLIGVGIVLALIAAVAMLGGAG
jgi:hypothetical protein